MEVKIGVQFAARELVVDSTQTPDEVEQLVNEALAAERKVLTLIDEKGRRVIVPTDKLAYVEIAEASSRTVGFTSA